MGVNQYTQGILRDDSIRTIMGYIISTKSMYSLHYQLIGKILLSTSRLLFLVDSVTFVICIAYGFLWFDIRSIIVEEGFIDTRLFITLCLDLTLLDDLLLMLLCQEWWLLFAYHTSYSSSWDFHEILSQLLIILLVVI